MKQETNHLCYSSIFNVKKVLLLSLVTALFLSSCVNLKKVKLMKSGEVQQKEFLVEIPFEYRLGLIVLKITIAGEEYDFLLDTGAPNVISKDLAEKLALKRDLEVKVGDSVGAKSDLEFTTIDSLSIGGIQFVNTGAGIADLHASEIVGCLNVDGFIGSNLMRKAIWKFDYQNQIITITHSMDSLNIPDSAMRAPFFAGLTGTPWIELRINENVDKNVIIDLGKTGGISLSKKSYDYLIKENPSVTRTYSYGQSSSGIYGMEKPDSTHYVQVPDMSFGEISIENAVIARSSNSSAAIGTQFIKNFDLILNWFTNEAVFVKRKDGDSGLSSFGFSSTKEGDKLIVSSVFENMKDLKIHDQILRIDTISYDKLTPEQWCKIVDNGLFENEREVIEITVLRENKELSFTLNKKKLI